MEEISIILQSNVTDYLEELVDILFDDEYFSFEEDAQKYVQKIYDFIEYNLPIFPFKSTLNDFVLFSELIVLFI